MKPRKVSRGSTAAALLALLLTLALPACGSASDTTSGSDASGGSSTGAAGPPRRGVALKKIGSFDAPVYVTAAPGFPKLLYVVEQPGRIAVLKNGRRLRKPFLDIRGDVSYGGERGLLSVAFPPSYARSKRFYVYYTDNAGNIRIDEFHRASATRAATSSRRKVILIPHPVNSNHNGGQLQFLGNLLYFGTGDGGSGGDPPNNAQSKDVLLGKLLRIDPRPAGGKPYSVPPDNPFVGKPGRDEIYSYGLRNPFRFSFDTAAKAPRIAIGDVGQNRFEELDYTTLAAANGANFGWDAFEGFSKYADENSGTPDPGNTVKPILAYSHSRGGSCSIIGGYVVCDPRLLGLRGRYLYTDLCEGQLRTLVPHLKRASDDRKLGLQVSSPSSFGEDDRHRLYVASLEGPVYRLVPAKSQKIYIPRETRCNFLSTLAMMPTMVREAWTDERLDDLQKHMDRGFAEVKAEIGSLRLEVRGEWQSLRSELKQEVQLLRVEVKGEIRALRTELKGEIGSLRTELKGEIESLRGEVRGEIGKLDAKFDRLTYTLIAALIGLLATHYLG